MARNFSLEVLGHLSSLRPKGVLCSPRAGLGDLLLASKKDAWALTCFPWAIVESKKEATGAPFCYCQAANASVVALKMIESLMLDEYMVGDDRVPPIIAFTTVGQTVRLWLTYCSKASDGSSEYVSHAY